MSARAIPADRRVSRVSERRYRRISGIGYCVTSVTRQRTPSSTLENTALSGPEPFAEIQLHQLQAVEEKPCFYQIGRVKAFGKAIVDGLQQRKGLSAPVLIAP